MGGSNSSIRVAAKATLLGGIVFLIPGFLAVFVLAKVFGMLKTLALAVGPRFGIASAFGGVLFDALAIVAVALVCLLAGLVARRATAQRMRTKLDQLLLGAIPGYVFVKGLAENIQQNEAMASSFVPVLVTFDDYWQVAFETHRASAGSVAVYLPGAPNPWSGTVVLVSKERVKRLGVSVTDTLKILRALGKGSDDLKAEYGPASKTG